MCIKEKTAIVKWNNNNKRFYEDKGYTFTRAGDEFEVKIDELSKNNKYVDVTPICYNCKKERIEKIKYCSYIKVISNNDGRYFCPECSYKRAGNNKRMSNEQFINKVHELVGNEYTFLDDYIKADKKISVRHNCRECNNYEYVVSPAKFLLGRRCPKCANNIKRTLEDFKEEVYQKFGSKYTILGEYVDTDTPILVRHNCETCGNYEWETAPKLLLKQESICPKCSKKARKNTDIFKEEVFNLVGNNYTILGEYKGASNKIKIRHNCERCSNHEYEVKPTNFLSGKRCPICSESRGEEKINRYFIDNNMEVTPQKKFDRLLGVGGKSLSYDFYLPSHNLLIEYQGEFHDGKGNRYTRRNLDKQIEHDKRKKEYAKNNNIKFLEIWYWDFDNIENILEKEFNLK